MADVEEASTGPTEPQSRNVIYCGVCSMPPEYCEYGGTVKKCQEWLQKNHPTMYERLWSEDALAAATSTLSVDAQKRAEKDALKKASKASAAEAKQQEVLASSKVRIKRVERNKRKYVTEVQGLDAFGLELKKVAKEFGSKFATGSSVTKVAGGGQEITVQGDLSMEIKEFILGKWKDVPGKNIVLEEPKKKKAADAEG
ncbi:translation machinery-associated 22 protein [Rutstroemia sp. NJR-2017a BBW]|nr:translation machinery-associated 22 protein [Rutstroemia sp. NJR-2017a BBW]